MNVVAFNFMNKALEQGNRKYRRTKKTRVPHTWRTVPNPFKDFWEEAYEQLEAKPEKTAKSFFEDLQKKYSCKFKDGQIRTMQRHVKAWTDIANLRFSTQINAQIFTSDDFTKVLSDADIKISMDGVGRWVDNLLIERLWRSLKYEEVYLKPMNL